MSEVDIAALTDDELDEFDVFLAASPEALLYYSSTYRRFLEELLDCRSEYWIARRSGQIVGVLPTMALDAERGTVVNSLPYYGSNGGALTADPDVSAALIGHWNELVMAPGVVAATWVSHPFLEPDEGAVRHTETDHRLAGFTTLPKSEAELYSRIDGSARRNVMKALRSGVTTTVENDAWDFLEEVHLENMGAMGGNAKQHRFFELLPAHFQADSDYRIYTASIDGDRVAGLLLLYFAGTVEYFTPVTRHRARTLQPMAPLLRDAMLDAAAAGCSRWNWGGTWSEQDGVGRFKRKWGAEFSEYRYFVQVNDDGLRDGPMEQLLATWPGFYVLPAGSIRQP